MPDEYGILNTGAFWEVLAGDEAATFLSLVETAEWLTEQV